MRAVVQRVAQAGVTIESRPRVGIEGGLLVLLGVAKGDTEEDARWLAKKILALRIFEDEERKLNRSIQDIQGQMLVISQFTLYGDCRKGRRPDFTAAGSPETAKRLYEQTIVAIKEKGVPVEAGVFAAHMDIDSMGDGPVTLILDSKKGA